MKVAVSIPDDVFSAAESLAKREKVSRSKLYSRALEHYVAYSEPDQVIAAINALVDELGPEDMRFHRRAANNIAKKLDW
jgi:metal-responsive CopG/Arc/MetJ family transcriptional regulator